MFKLYHYPFCPLSRYARLLVSEYDINVELIEEAPWRRRHDFMLLNPAGSLPVFIELHRKPIVGVWALSEYFEETRGEHFSSRHLMPGHAGERAEVRRLCDWFLGKLYREVSELLVEEKIYKRLKLKEGLKEDIATQAIHAALKNIRPHLRYLEHLLRDRPWVACEHLTQADLAAAAQLSSLDYFADVPWDEAPVTREWYSKVKSRPSFRPFLSERIDGIFPATHYDNLDF